MGAVVVNAGWAGAPGWLVLPERPGASTARELVEQALDGAALGSATGGSGLPAVLTLVSGSWRLDVRELRSLAEAMATRGVALAGQCGSDPFTRVAAAAIGLSTQAPLPAPLSGLQSATAATPQELTLHQGTLRSGDHLESEGSVLVLGDVNPGARISAGGHVLVWGRLRGSAHAGCQGNADARIVALQLRPLQLRIAAAVARGPEDSPPPGLAEQAVLSEGAIRLEAASPVWPLALR
jgi:septum site-determining protein MinC